jgi:hypothetical protein
MTCKTEAEIRSKVLVKVSRCFHGDCIGFKVKSNKLSPKNVRMRKVNKGIMEQDKIGHGTLGQEMRK